MVIKHFQFRVTRNFASKLSSSTQTKYEVGGSSKYQIVAGFTLNRCSVRWNKQATPDVAWRHQWVICRLSNPGVINSEGLFIWARSPGLAGFQRSHFATFFFVKTSMCSFQKPGWPGYRDLGNQDENFPIWTLQPGWPGRNFLRPKWHNFCRVCISTSKACEFVKKLQESTKVRQPRTIQVYVPPFWFSFLNFIPVDQAKISHMNR